MSKKSAGMGVLPYVLFVACANNPMESADHVVPIITTQPESQIVKVGDSVTLSVVATGSPAPDYEWRKSGSVLVGVKEASLTIPAAVFDDSGTYSVVVSNSEGSATSDPAILAVYTIAVQPMSDTVAVGSAFAFTVVTEGIPEPAFYEWRFEGFPIPGATDPTYTKSSAALIDAGFYRAVVSCPVGTVFSDTVQLTVIP